jgi:hypothetical protein
MMKRKETSELLALHPNDQYNEKDFRKDKGRKVSS